MRKVKGFKLGKRILTAYRCIFRRRRAPASYQRIDSPTCKINKSLTKLSNWCKSKAKRLCCGTPGPGYLPLGQEPLQEKTVHVPKGQMAVYVGRKDVDGEFSRVLVPVIYCNHPLFGQLLREAADEFGYHHPGGITIPCQISEFEKVQTTIAAGTGARRLKWH